MKPSPTARPPGEEARIAAAFDEAPVGMAILDTGCRVLRVNRALERIDGVPATDHEGKLISEVLPHLDPSATETQRDVLTTGRSAVDHYVSGTRPGDGRERVWSVHYSRLEAGDGSVLGLSCLVLEVTERHAAFTELRATRERLALLSDASDRIGSTLDIETTAHEATDVAVPRFCDVATLEVIEQHLRPEVDQPPPSSSNAITTRRIAQRAVSGVSPWQRADAPPFRTYVSGTPMYETLRTGRPLFAARLDEASIMAGARDVEQARRGWRAGIRSSIIVPLLARGTVLGMATFARTVDTPPFARADVEIAEELASRAAVCIDNARLYARVRAVAISLQHSLLPDRLPKVDGIDVAFRYLPGGDAAEVGGDWFDVIQLAGARAALVVGDVMGSGVHAAGIMGQFRTAVRTLAGLDLAPSQVLRQLDELAVSLSESHIATCVYVVYDSSDGSCAMGSAGHPPPLLAEPSGEVRRLEPPVGAPLGVGGSAYESYQFHVPSGSRLVLYTDGMVEERGTDIDEGIEAMANLLAGADDDLDELCETLIAPRTGVQRYDDATVLAACLTELLPNHVSRWVLTTEPAVVSRARELVRKQLEEWSLEGLCETAELLVSELVTNALTHARGPLELRLMLADGLVCEVADALRASPEIRRARVTDEGGRGLHLVNELAVRWGTRGTRSGKIVWFELPYPAGHTRPERRRPTRGDGT